MVLIKNIYIYTMDICWGCRHKNTTKRIIKKHHLITQINIHNNPFENRHYKITDSIIEPVVSHKKIHINESNEHNRAKCIISENKNLEFYHTCLSCKEEYKVDICNKNTIAEKEYYWKEEEGGGKDKLYIPDVAFLNSINSGNI